jgi:hypothetical protein
MMQSSRSLATLRTLLTILALLGTAGGLFLLFGSSKLLSWFLPALGPEASTLFVIISKFIGALAFFVAYLAFVTARDPVRYAAVVDGLAGIMFLLALIDVYSITMLQFGNYYPAWAIWTRVLVRVAIGITLILLRPRGAPVN